MLYYPYFKSQLDYYKAARKAKELQEQNIKEIFDGQTQSSKEDKENLIREIAIAHDLEQIYKYEVEKYNIGLKEVKEGYISTKQLINQFEGKYKEFISKIMGQYKLILMELNNNMEDFLKECKNMIESNNTINVVHKDLGELFINQKYTSYDEFYKQDPNSKLLDFDLFDNQEEKITEKEFSEFSQEILAKLFSTEELNCELISKFIKIINDSNFDISKRFLDLLLEKKKDVSLKFLNLNNLEHLANFLGHISLNCISVFSGKFEMNFKIIFIAERFFYVYPEDNSKIYLSALLSKNKYFRTKFFWRDVIELKLANKIQDHITRLQSLSLPQDKKPSLFSKLGETFGITNELKKTSLLYNCRIKALIKNYDLVNNSKIPILDRILTKEMSDLIKDTIPNFSNFNFPCEEALDMIVELAQEYKLPKDNIKYYVTYQNVSNYTIRKNLPSEIKGRYKKVITVNKMDDTSKLMKFFGLSLKYLTKKDYLNLLLVCRNAKLKLAKKMYKIILKDEHLDNRIRLNIWRNLLKVDNLKKEYNYENISQNKENIKVPVEIKMDVARTGIFAEDKSKEELKQTLIRILTAISIVNVGVGYCQGMNYLAEFLYELTHDENETFYLMLGFFKSTEYPMIFEKDLSKLKIFFYIFNRIVSLFEPELYSYFNSHNVDVNLFIPPWFITLFLTARQFNKEMETPIVLIRILDNFLISGWKFMMKVGIKILHLYESKLMELKYEDMLTYLINDMPKCDFFLEKNPDNIEKVLEEKNITKALITKIENEFTQKMELENSEKN
ncbi:MAG: TBC domain-containing protein [archaeon]|nr:TBC domain-containing protein [archaeon]